MHILGKTWRDGHLDYYRPADEMRIAPKAWWVLGRLSDVHLEQSRSLRRVWNYVREVGVGAVIRKIRSRLAESLRNRQVFAVGIGEVVEGGEAHGYPKGSPAVFVAPRHPECTERLVLPPECVAPIPAGEFEPFCHPAGIYLFEGHTPEREFAWPEVIGWSRFTGSRIDHLTPELLRWVRQEFQHLEPTAARLLPLPEATPVEERVEAQRADDEGLRAAVFGFGHYAKINVLPNFGPPICVRCIHDIDPTQLAVNRDPSIAYDTCGDVREDEEYDVYIIAGYHHTHADLAVRALHSGAYAIVEKPLVTTSEQLVRLLAAVEEHPGRIFACFQMRYNPLWELARQDLKLGTGDPVHYHCIVYEIPLPQRHWYKWPNSGSRLLSNGCHWIDHFLFMNGYARTGRHDLWKANNGDLHVSVELENGAVFGMCLTDVGSQRIGVQEHIELRANGSTVTVDNGAKYLAEDSHRVIRRRRINKYSLYERMYRSIRRKILNGDDGDSYQSVQRTSALVLELERACARP